VIPFSLFPRPAKDEAQLNMLKKALLISTLAVLLSAPAAAQQTVFLVRHAERADMEKRAPPSDDPDLSTAGRARAESLATLLKDADIRAIFITKYKRTRQTAGPLATASGLSPIVMEATTAGAIAKEIRAQKGNVLVVGHSNTVPDTLKALDVETAVKIGDQDFDNLFVVTAGPTPTLLRLHYR
jgi:broad specificity phosphatase PhoE